MKEHETYAEDEVTCPFCMATVSDSWELSDGGTRECGECGKKYGYERDVEITYSSWSEDE